MAVTKAATAAKAKKAVKRDGIEVTNAAVAETRAALQRGVPIIAQAALVNQGWNGRADVLRRIEVPSAL